MLFLDEPALPVAAALLGRAEALRLLNLVLAALPGVVRGVHCCAEPPLDLLAELPLRVVSIDAHRYDAAMISLWSALAVAGVPAVALARQSLVTPACGLAGLTEAAAARAMRLCGEVAQALRAEVAA